MFHTDQISGNPLGSRRRLSAPVVLAAGLHAAAALFVLGARTWTIDEQPDPPIQIIFSDWKRAALGDGSKAETGPKAVEHPTSHRGAFHEGVSSSAVPADRTADIIPDSSRERARPDGEGVTGDSDLGDSGTPGARDGDPFGTDDRNTGSNFDRTGSSEIIRVGGAVVAPKLVFRVEPAYSEGARALRAEGVVVLEAVISASGTVENVRVLHSAHPLLDAAAVRAVGEWRYEPATLGHRAVRVYLTVTVSFALRR